MGAMPHFSPDAPPADWVRQHEQPRGHATRLLLTKGGAVTTIVWYPGAEPVRRIANHHYASAILRGEQRVSGEFYFM